MTTKTFYRHHYVTEDHEYERGEDVVVNHRYVIAASDSNGQEKGELELFSEVPVGLFESLFNHCGTISLSIRVVEEFEGRGVARGLLGELVNNCIFGNFEHAAGLYDRDQLWFYVGADSSDGFWDHVGMRDGHHGNYDDDRHVSGRHRVKNSQGFGMEKSIRFCDLLKFVT